MTVWQRCGTWRRSRPFWGGLLTVLAGVEIIASTKMTLAGATLSVGLTGLQSLLIPFMLVVAGLLAWFTPAQRMFYGLVAVFVAIYSLLAVNFGGWFLGTLLGIAGGALIFAWNPDEPPGDTAEQAGPPSGDGQVADMDGLLDGPIADTLLDGPIADTLPPAVNPLRDGVPGPRRPSPAETAADETMTGERRPGGPRHAAAVIAVATLAASALSLVVAQQPARAADCPPQPTASAGPVHQVIGGIIDAIGGLLGVNQPSPSPSASPKPCAPSPSPSATGKPKPSAGPTGGSSPTASPSGATPPAKAPILKAAKNQKPVAACPARMTGTRVSMEGLSFDGIVDLPTADGVIRTLRFSMDRSDTARFKLRTCAEHGFATETTTPKLTVSGDRVLFYTSRFRGNAFGILPVDYTPDEPPLLTPPLVFFTDPVIDLVFVDAPRLTAPDMVLKLVKA